MTKDEMREAATKAMRRERASWPVHSVWSDAKLCDAALRIAIPWAREQALREAARVANSSALDNYKKHSETKDRYAQQFHLVQISASEKIALAIEALIPARPSQETTDE